MSASIEPLFNANSSANAMSILSPPASPYPDLSSLQQYMKKREVAPQCSVVRATPASSIAATPQQTTDAASGAAPKSAKMVTCWKSLLADPVKYYERERSLLSLYPIRKQNWSNYIYVENPTPTNAKGRRARVNRVRGPSRATPYSDGGDDSDAVMMQASSRQSVEAASSAEGSSDSDQKRSPKKRAAPNTSRVHDLSIAQLEDFSPSCSLLPPGRSLRAEWKGAPMDLSNDPDAHLLHPAEVHLASVLRLPAEVYIDSKRRLFAEKVHRMRQGLAFRRTDSQKACRIDVNKASRLFGAFERVGWLDDELFTKFL